MEFKERSFVNSKGRRPKPFVLQKEETKTMVVVTSWTAPADAERVAQLLVEQHEKSAPDDVTVLHKNPLTMSDEEHLVESLKKVHDLIYRQENSRNIRSLYEVLYLVQKSQSLVWAQVGQPHLSLVRSNLVFPIGYQVEHSSLAANLAPLPQNGLGLDAYVRIQSGTLHLQKGDELILSTQTSAPIQNLNPAVKFNFENLSAHLGQKDVDLPFWLGWVQL